MPSTAIRHLSYSASTRELRVTFTSGRRYAYAQVPPEVHEAFRTAPSRGAFFNHRVRDRFSYREIERSGRDRQRRRRG
ncbi:MAG: KTSC domain-containing protein [Bradyrhizobiaceae bacterium PARB1]|nr:MAG: KTSC domain-containing protein [Bradyrhizobiaceae bacterium PARB1]